MQNIIRKVYMSIMTVILVSLTLVTTTFAWVGILTYNQLSSFDLNLKTEKLNSDYYLSISATEDGIYGESANVDDIEYQILKNRGKKVDSIDRKDVSKMFSNETLMPTTVTYNGLLTNDFHSLDLNNYKVSGNKSNDFFRFDLYLSVEHRYGDSAITEDVNNTVDVLFPNISESLKGNKKQTNIINAFSYPSENLDYNGLYSNYLPTFDKLEFKDNEYVTVDSSSAARFALAFYEPILRDENYTGSEVPKSLYIYQGGTQAPSYNDNTYSFGGILPEEYNLAYNEHKKIYNLGNDFSIPSELINRGDLELVDDNKQLLDSNFGLGIVNGKKTKVKVTVWFWFEGWDADCFHVIDRSNVELNLIFATGEENRDN